MGSIDEPNVDSHKHSNEYVGSIKDEECDKFLSDY
jgi:hypothetical protein